MASYILLTAALICIVFLLPKLLSWKNYADTINKIPGPKTLPIIGNLLDMAAINFNPNNLDSKHGIVRFWLFNIPLIIITDTKYLRSFYNSPILATKADFYENVEQLFGKGNVVTTSGAEFKKAKKILTQTYGIIPQNALFEAIQKEISILLPELRKKSKDGFFSYHPIALTSQMALVTDIGLDEDARQHKDLLKFPHCLEDIRDVMLDRFKSPLHYFDATFFLTKEGKKCRRAIESARETVAKYCRIKKRECEDLKSRCQPIPNKFIYNLLDKFGEQPLEDLVSQIMTFYLASLDTTATSLGFTLILLGLHPDVQEKAYLEDLAARELKGSEHLELQDLKRHPYMESIAKESLRLFPPGPILGRKASEETHLGEYKIPANTNVFAVPYVTARSEKYFTNPNRFDPDRFFIQKLDEVEPYAWAPFSLGKRACLGSKFGFLNLKLTLIYIVRNFKIHSKYKDMQELMENFAPEATIVEKGGVCIRLEERKSN